MARKVGDRRSSCLRQWSLAVCLTSMLVYLNALKCELVFDDVSAVRENPDVLGHTSLRSVMSNDFWGTAMHLEQSHKSYRPLTVLTFRLNHLIHQLRPMGFHLVNVLLHSIVTLLFLRFCTQVFHKDGPHYSQFKDSGAVWASLLFAVHPIHTEAVVGVVGRAELLAAIFYLVALMVYRRCVLADLKGGVIRHLVLMSCFSLSVILATLSKEQGITVLGVALVLDLFFLRTSKLNIFFFSRLLFIIITGSLLLITRLRLMQNTLPVFTVFDNPAAHEGWPEQQLTFLYLLALNARLMVLPVDLCCDWTMGTVPIVKVEDSRNLISIGTFGIILVMGVKALTRKDGTLVLGMAMIAIPFLPASNLFFHVGFVVAERVLYLPSMGFAIIVSRGLHSLCEHVKIPSLQYWLLSLLVLSHSAMTVRRSLDWQTEHSLFASGLLVTSSNAKLFNNLGHALENEERYAEALKYFTMASRLQKDDAGAHINVGRTMLKLNMEETEIEKAFNKALELMPKATNNTVSARVAPHHLNVFLHLASLLTRNNRLEEADDLLRRATLMRPDFVRAMINRGDVLVRLQRHAEAEEVFKRALTFEPNNADVLHNLGVVKLAIGELQSALVYFDEALKRDSQHLQALISSASLMQESNDQRLRPTAFNRLNKALQLVNTQGSSSSMLERIHFNLGMLLTDDNQLREAEEAFETALTLKPSSRSARFNLALLLSDQERHREALRHLEQLLSHHPHHIKALVLMGDIFTNHERDLKRARQCYEAIVDIDQHHIQARHNLCVLLVEEQRLQEALHCLIEVERLVLTNDENTNQFEYVIKHRRILEARINKKERSFSSQQ